MSGFISGQLTHQPRNLSCPAWAYVNKRDAHSTLAVQHGDVSQNPELKLVRHKVDFHPRPAFESQMRCLDVAPGETEIQNPAAKKQASLRQKDLGKPFAPVARMSPLFVFAGLHYRRCR